MNKALDWGLDAANILETIIAFLNAFISVIMELLSFFGLGGE